MVRVTPTFIFHLFSHSSLANGLGENPFSGYKSYGFLVTGIILAYGIIILVKYLIN